MVVKPLVSGRVSLGAASRIAGSMEITSRPPLISSVKVLLEGCRTLRSAIRLL